MYFAVGTGTGGKPVPDVIYIDLEASISGV